MITTSLRQAMRRLATAPGFSAAVVLTLALGIGATTAVFSVVDVVLLRPLPYHDPDRLMSVAHTVRISGISEIDQSDATLLFYRRHNNSFTGIAGYRSISVNLGSAPAAGGDASQPERVLASRVSAGLFGLLGVPPIEGREFMEGDDVANATPVVMLGELIWRQRYAADRTVIGQAVEIDGVPHTVIGVMPASFRFPDTQTTVWVPLRLDPRRLDSAAFDYQAIGRLREGVTPAAAAADLLAGLPRVPDEFPGRLTAASIQQIEMTPVVRPLRDQVVGDISRVLWVVFGAAIFVLATACANVANLFLVRADGRQKELAVRRALGARPRDLVLQLVSESAVLTLLGGVLGTGAAAAGIRLLRAVGPDLAFARLPELDLNVTLLFTALFATVAVALFVSGVPAWRYSRTAAGVALTQTSRAATAGRDRHRMRAALVAAQVALALVLLTGAGLMAQSFLRLRAVHPGFEPRQAFAFRVAVPAARYATPAEAARFFIEAVDEMAAVPSIEAAAVVSKLPLDSAGKVDTGVFVEDRPRAPAAMPNIHDVAYVTPGYFAAMGIPLLSGRTLEPPNPDSEPREVVVSRGFAERYWKGESPIGRRVRILVNGPWFTVVGVAGPVHGTALEQPADETVYCSIVTAASDRRWAPRDLAFVARTTGDPAQALAASRDLLRRRDATLPIYGARTLEEVLSIASARTTATFALLVSACGIALLLGMVGIYGVMSYAVALRAREIGVRLALGAQPRDVRRMVSRQAMTVVAAGLAAGAAGAAALTRVLANLLFEVSPTDPLTFTAALAVLGVTAYVAGWIPARRAARIDPLTTLGTD